MTPGSTENNATAALPQEKVDTIPAQEKVDVTSVQQEVKSDEKEDPNWRAFREARKKDRAEKEAAERRAAEKEAEAAALKAAMEAAFAKSAPTPQAYQQYYGVNQEPEESEDERIEKKVQAALAIREAAAEKARREREQQELPQRLLHAYPDYHQIS